MKKWLRELDELIQIKEEAAAQARAEEEDKAKNTPHLCATSDGRVLDQNGNSVGCESARGTGDIEWA